MRISRFVISVCLILLFTSGIVFAICSSDPGNPVPRETITVSQGQQGVSFDIPYRDPDGNVAPFGIYAPDINVVSKPAWVTVGPLVPNDPNVAVGPNEVSPCDGQAVTAAQTLTMSRRLSVNTPTNAYGTFQVVVEIRDAYNARNYYVYTIRVNRVPFLGTVVVKSE